MKGKKYKRKTIAKEIFVVSQTQSSVLNNKKLTSPRASFVYHFKRMLKKSFRWEELGGVKGIQVTFPMITSRRSNNAREPQLYKKYLTDLRFENVRLKSGSTQTDCDCGIHN